MNSLKQYYNSHLTIDEDFRPECPICGCIDEWEIENDGTIVCSCCGHEFINISNITNGY